jgi:hypothetical protein
MKKVLPFITMAFAKKALRVSDVTLKLDKVSAQCSKDQLANFQKLSNQEKMTQTSKSGTFFKNWLLFSKNTSYNKTEYKHKLRHCYKEKDPKSRKSCFKISSSMVKKGQINYITLKGRKALNSLCRLTHDISSCRE